MWQKVIKAGNSKAVTIPAKFSQSVGIKLGDKVKSVSRPQSGQITYTFSGARQLSLNNNLSLQHD